jgi:hypothetical protein
MEDRLLHAAWVAFVFGVSLGAIFLWVSNLIIDQKR